MDSDILTRNNVTLTGEDTRPIMFAHGFGCDQSMWRAVAPEFERDHRVVLFDLTGAGQSDLSAYDDDRYGTLDGHARDILDIADALDLRDAILVGHSVSAITSVLAANMAPDRFSRLVLVAPSPCFMNLDDYRGGFEREDLEGLIAFMEENYLGWAEQLAPTIVGQTADGAEAGELTQSFCRTDPEIAKHFGRVTFLSDRRADMPHVQVPSLILQCDDDAIAPVSVGEWMHANMPGSTLVVLNAKGHCPHMTVPDKTAQTIRQFIADA